MLALAVPLLVTFFTALGLARSPRGCRWNDDDKAKLARILAASEAELSVSQNGPVSRPELLTALRDAADRAQDSGCPKEAALLRAKANTIARSP